jgi:hypothetical protein
MSINLFTSDRINQGDLDVAVADYRGAATQFHLIHEGETFFVLSQGKNEVYSHEKVQRCFSEAPEFLSQFIKEIKKHPQLILRAYEYKNLRCEFSKELQSGLKGERGVDHHIPVDILQACIRKRYKKMYEAISNGKTDFDYYLLVEDRVLNLVAKFFPKQNLLNVTTAYYPTRNVLLDRRKFTDVAYDAWKSKLPKI